MNKSILFGTKEKFAIELGFTQRAKIFKLGFWINGRRLGSFTKGGELKYSIREYQRFIRNKDFFYLSVFDEMTPSEIFDYLLLIFFKPAGKKLAKNDAESRKKFHLIFGDQFTNQNGSFLLLYKDEMVVFIIKRPNQGPVDRYDVDFDVFTGVFNEYIQYAERNSLL